MTDEGLNPLDVPDATDVEVRVTGDTAIVTGLVHEKGLLTAETVFRRRRLTNFSRQNGRSVCIAVHEATSSIKFSQAINLLRDCDAVT